jgi:hypothetical protein
MIITLTISHHRPIKKIIINATRFATGEFSIADAYRHQEGWPGRMGWGGIYPASEMVWSQIPLKSRVWSMHVHTYCMLPDCNMQGYMSFQLSPNVRIIYFGEPIQAKLLLQREKLNYFFFSDSLILTDPLPLTPLFSPQNISQYLGIVWTDGHNTLLTWKEDAKAALTTAWIQRYQVAIDKSNAVRQFPYENMRSILGKYST